MSCYKPLYGKFIGYFDGKPQYKISGFRASGFKSHPADVHVPCGQCIGCRLDYSRAWADRMMLELDHSKVAIFVTLTYDNDHVPVSEYDDAMIPKWFTLDKRDVQLFLKRLRKHFYDKEIRYFISGEYGPKTLRPHYHGIIFGLSLSDFDLIPYKSNEFGQMLYSSSILSDIWSKGYVTLADVSWQTCAYVSRYVTKKLTGEMSVTYDERNCLPEFSLMSRKPGISGYFAVEHPEKLREPNLYITDLNGVSPRNKVSTPKYLIDKLELTNPMLYDKIKAQRKGLAEDRVLLELSKTDLGLSEYFDMKEVNQTKRASLLKRGDLHE